MKIELHTNVEIVRMDVREMGEYLQRCINELEDRVVEKLSPLKAREEMTKGVTQTLCMHTCQKTTLASTPKLRMLDTCYNKKTRRCWHWLAWVV